MATLTKVPAAITDTPGAITNVPSAVTIVPSAAGTTLFPDAGGGGGGNTHNVVAVGATAPTAVAANSVGNFVQVGA